MKMKKLFSGVLALALVCSTFISVSAETPEETSVSPVITGKVSQIRSGRAVVEFSIDTNGDYGVEYDSDWGEYSGTTASGISTIQVGLTLDPIVDELFSAISATTVLGDQPVTVDGKSVTYAFGVGSPTAYGQNGSVLFRLNCTLKDSSMTLEKIKEYNLVKSFDKLIVYTKIHSINGVALGELVNDTQYRNDGEGDYADISGVYEYTAPVIPDSPITDKKQQIGETGAYNGKTLIHVAQVLKSADPNKKVVITKKIGDADPVEQVSDRTLSQILGGVAVDNSVLTGEIAIGVLTTDTTAVFGFELR